MEYEEATLEDVAAGTAERRVFSCKMDPGDQNQPNLTDALLLLGDQAYAAILTALRRDFPLECPQSNDWLAVLMHFGPRLQKIPSYTFRITEEGVYVTLLLPRPFVLSPIPLHPW